MLRTWHCAARQARSLARLSPPVSGTPHIYTAAHPVGDVLNCRGPGGVLYPEQAHWYRAMVRVGCTGDLCPRCRWAQPWACGLALSWLRAATRASPEACTTSVDDARTAALRPGSSTSSSTAAAASLPGPAEQAR